MIVVKASNFAIICTGLLSQAEEELALLAVLLESFAGDYSFLII